MVEADAASRESDVTLVGGGVNALVCALALARAGLQVDLVEDRPAIAGVHRTEYPFPKASRLGTFTGAHRVGFVPKALEVQLGLKLPLAPRAPSLFVPTVTAGRYVLTGPSNEGLRAATGGVVGPRDVEALGAMHAELDALVADLAPSWTTGPFAIEEVAERYVRAALREAFVKLCRGSFAEYAARFGIQSGLVKATLAADALGGSFASWDTPGSGAPLLVRHAACSLVGGGDAVPIAGMGALARTLVDAAEAAGVVILRDATVAQVLVEGNTVSGVVLTDGTTRRTGALVTSADPWRLRALVGADRFPAEYMRRVDGLARPGSVAKLLVAFDKLPDFACLEADEGQHRATTFLLPSLRATGEDDTVRALGRAFADASAGRLPTEPSVELVFPSVSDASLRDPEGRHSASMLVPWAPYDLTGTTWSAEEERFTSLLLDVLESFAPGARARVSDTVLLHPKKLETHFGVTRGHLGHVDDTLLFGDRLPAATPVHGLYTCGRACGPAGGVLGAAGLIAARRVIADFELALERTEVGIRR